MAGTSSSSMGARTKPPSPNETPSGFQPDSVSPNQMKHLRQDSFRSNQWQAKLPERRHAGRVPTIPFA
jgi:hypothetical protein